MKSDDFLNLLGDIDEKYIYEARYMEKKYWPMFYRYLIWAAGFVLFVVSIIWLSKHIMSKEEKTNVAELSAGEQFSVDNNEYEEPGENNSQNIPQKDNSIGTEITREDTISTEENALKEYANVEETVTVHSGIEEFSSTESHAIAEVSDHTEGGALSEENIIVNRLPQNADNAPGAWYSVSPNSFYMENVTSMSADALQDYYSLSIDVDSLSERITDITGVSVVPSPGSTFFFDYGVYRNGDYIYDINGFIFSFCGENDLREIRIAFSRYTNIPFPGAKYYGDPVGMIDSSWKDNGLKTSVIDGRDCLIGLAEISNLPGFPPFYKAQTIIRGTTVMIDIYEMPEEQVINIIRTVFNELEG